jgi:hypothetical protein
LAEIIATDELYDTIIMPADGFDKIINFWECLRFINYNNEEFRTFIDKILKKYYDTNQQQPDDVLYKRLPKSTKYDQVALAKARAIERYDVTLFIEADKCECSGYGESCEYCRTVACGKTCSLCRH